MNEESNLNLTETLLYAAACHLVDPYLDEVRAFAEGESELPMRALLAMAVIHRLLDKEYGGR